MLAMTVRASPRAGCLANRPFCCGTIAASCRRPLSATNAPGRTDRLAVLDFLLAQPDVMADIGQFMALSREHTEVATLAGAGGKRLARAVP